MQNDKDIQTNAVMDLANSLNCGIILYKNVSLFHTRQRQKKLMNVGFLVIKFKTDLTIKILM